MTSLIVVPAALIAFYALFLAWYGGRTRPLTPAEIARFEREFASLSRGADGQAELQALRELVARDDGREFVMHNLVRYRARALYPPGYDFDDDPRAADRRYARAILWPLCDQAGSYFFPAAATFSEDTLPLDTSTTLRLLPEEIE